MPRKRKSTRNTRPAPLAFTPVKLRARRDGWSVELQCAFLAELHLKGSVAAAARAVGKSRASAYKLRGRDGAQEFAQSWDRILQRACGDRAAPPPRAEKVRWRKLTLSDLRWRAGIGRLRPVIYRGKMRRIAQKPNHSALIHLVRRYDAAARRIERGRW